LAPRRRFDDNPLRIEFECRRVDVDDVVEHVIVRFGLSLDFGDGEVIARGGGGACVRDAG
jgi:hypothetical protein